MINEALLQKARLHVRRWFAERMPSHLVFHDLEHTLTVTRTALALGRSSGLKRRELQLLELAALFHDTGYALKRKGHEKESARIASAFLVKHGVAHADQLRVHALIMATRPAVEPRGILQRVLRDADQAKAGQPDFLEKSERLRDELAHVQAKPPGPKAWLRANILYLQGHRFHTTQALKRYGAQKTINLNELIKREASPAKADAVGRLKERFVDRDLSWLSFNERVLQEAQDTHVPLLERVKFLGIFSNNLDEFYRVRVAGLRSLAKLKKGERSALEVPPSKRVERINRKALGQQRRFGAVWRRALLPALSRAGIRFLQEGEITDAQRLFAEQWFLAHIAPLLQTAAMRAGNAPFIEDRKLYLACRVRQKGKDRMVLLNVPSDTLGRFLELPAPKGRTHLMFLDDVIRLNLDHIFIGHKVIACHSIKLSRDADLYLDEEFAETVVDRVRRSLKKRRTGVPSRFLYDSEMPAGMLKGLSRLLGLNKADLVPGGRYHHFSDLLKLSLPGHAPLKDRPLRPVQHPALRRGSSLFATLRERDMLLHFPYHDFSIVTTWLQRAAHDPAVTRIAITLYRVAHGSEVCKALLVALQQGKRVTVFVEVQARFDEGSNLYWGDVLEKAGATVLYSYAHLKVHCKLLLVERREGGKRKQYAYLGTGNFNERTSRIYSDSALLTSRPAITDDVAAVFRHLADRRVSIKPRHLLLAPDALRPGLEALIDTEAALARRGQPASILLKLNSLEDKALIRKLYHAGRAGVRIRIIVRGICCLVPGVPGLSENIEAISIVDKFLEHARAYVFHNGGDPLVYMASADFMERNMDRRIEAAFPLIDPRTKQEVLDMLELQWNDTVKARVIDEAQTNPYKKRRRGADIIRSQQATAEWLRRKARTKYKGGGR
ncbi:MAG: polyphosphate kinase 1 [Flavobacteriales bacterium]